MNQKGISSIVIILIIVGVLLAGGGIYWWQSNTINNFINQRILRGVFNLKGCDIYIGGKPACDNDSSKNSEQSETANWQTYRNEEYGFEIKYPNNWRFESDPSNNKISIIFPGGETSSPTLVIQFPIEKYSETLAKEERNFNEWQQESIEQPSGEINDITFAGTPAKEFLYYSPVGFTEQVIILSKNNQTIVIKSFKNSVLDPILSTFKFTK